MSPEGGRVRWWAAVFWLAVWQAGSMALGSALLLPSPLHVLARLAALGAAAAFWRAVVLSASRIAGGFLLALTAGVGLAALSCRWRRVEELLSPAMLAIRSVPVASFTVLALLWVSAKNLSVLITFLMALPVLYAGALQGLRAADPALLEMGRVFRLSPLRRLRFLRLPALWPHLSAACAVSMGLSWKAGTAAEIIGIPAGSLGERMQQAKVYLNTADLFACTLAVVVLSLCFERGAVRLLRLGERLFREV
ncbi:MAG: ABC transporter permease subunit [Oscillospiraceae bacterium]|nr:ABC transporter permease subunit [Oscillospiraceae bacterium]